MQVEVREDIEKMIRRCLKGMERSGLLKELKLRAIAKPSVRRREKQLLSGQRRKKREQAKAKAEEGRG